MFLAATKQLLEYLFLSISLSLYLSVCLSLRPSVCLWHLFHYVPVIMKFSGVITNDKSDLHAKVKVIGQRSRSQRS